MKSLRTLFGLFLLVAGIYVGYRLIPPYFNNYQFQNALESEAQLNTYSAVRKSDEEIRAGIMKQAADLDLPVRPEQIQIARARTGYEITVDYTVHVDLLVRPVDLDFHTSSKK